MQLYDWVIKSVAEMNREVRVQILAKPSFYLILYKISPELKQTKWFIAHYLNKSFICPWKNTKTILSLIFQSFMSVT